MRRLVLSACLLLFSPLATAANLAGLWVGYYAYDPGENPERVECAVVLEQIGSRVGGSMIERQTFGEMLFPGLPSDVMGEIENNTLTFHKLYVHESEDDPPVSYRLSISPDGNVLSGFWSIGDMQGTATFRRVTAASSERRPPIQT
jgi:hypothetical protein